MGKPLISNAMLQSMARTVQVLRAAKRDRTVLQTMSRTERAALPTESEALYAAMLLQVHRRDTLVIEGGDALAKLAVATYFPPPLPGPSQILCAGSTEEAAALAAGVALKQKAAPRAANLFTTVSAATQPVTVALLRGFSTFAGVLPLMQQHDLALLLVVQSEPLTRAEVQRRGAATTVPLLMVDDADAVALCRVFQESMLRARHGWGGAVIHATRLPGAPDALASLQQHLRNRGLLSETAPV